jgi:hypothetical protein
VCHQLIRYLRRRSLCEYRLHLIKSAVQLPPGTIYISALPKQILHAHYIKLSVLVQVCGGAAVCPRAPRCYSASRIRLRSRIGADRKQQVRQAHPSSHNLSTQIVLPREESGVRNLTPHVPSGAVSFSISRKGEQVALHTSHESPGSLNTAP